MTVLDSVRKILTGAWKAPFEVQRELAAINEEWFFSESGVSARIRDLRKIGIDVDKRKREGKSFYEYTIAGPQRSLF